MQHPMRPPVVTPKKYLLYLHDIFMLESSFCILLEGIDRSTTATTLMIEILSRYDFLHKSPSTVDSHIIFTDHFPI